MMKQAKLPAAEMPLTLITFYTATIRPWTPQYMSALLSSEFKNTSKSKN